MYLKIPAGKHLMELVAVDWFKDTKRMDHVARRSGCAARVSVIGYRFLFLVPSLIIAAFIIQSLDCCYCTDFLSDSLFQT